MKHELNLEVVEDVADEGDVTHPLLSRPLPRLLSALKLLLQPVQKVTPEHAFAALFRLRLQGATAKQHTHVITYFTSHFHASQRGSIRTNTLTWTILKHMRPASLLNNWSFSDWSTMTLHTASKSTKPGSDRRQ